MLYDCTPEYELRRTSGKYFLTIWDVSARFWIPGLRLHCDTQVIDDGGERGGGEGGDRCSGVAVRYGAVFVLMSQDHGHKTIHLIRHACLSPQVYLYDHVINATFLRILCS